MVEEVHKDLRGVAETLLFPLYIRAMETKRPDALLHDEKAVVLVERLHMDGSWLKKMALDDDHTISVILRNREFDQKARDFLTRNPRSVVVHIGCGLDSRFERVDNGQVEWYDLDFPAVITLRRKYLGDGKGRYHLLACSALDETWYEAVNTRRQRPFLFLAEGVLMYFEEAQVRSLFLAIRDHFPGAELVCDASSPYTIWVNNLRYSRTGIEARFHWALKNGRDVEKWGDGIRLLSEWFYFDTPEPRMSRYRWMRFIPGLAKASGIFHYRLGNAAG